MYLFISFDYTQTAACRVSRMDSTIFTVSGVYNVFLSFSSSYFQYYLVAPYVPAITVICATDYNLPRSILTEVFSLLSVYQSLVFL